MDPFFIFFFGRDPSKPAIDEAGFLSLMFVTWATPIIKKGFKKSLQLEDFDLISQNESAKLNFDRGIRIWKEEVARKGLMNASMSRMIWRAARTRLIFGIIFFLLSQLLTFVVPVSILWNLIRTSVTKNGEKRTSLDPIILWQFSWSTTVTMRLEKCNTYSQLV